MQKLINPTPKYPFYHYHCYNCGKGVSNQDTFYYNDHQYHFSCLPKKAPAKQISKFLFVYGTLRRGYSNHRRLENAKFVQEDTISGFTMHSLGGFPGLVQGSSVIFGEVYEINDQILQSCDYLEGYPRFYNRKVVETSTGIRVWVYYLEGKSYSNRPIVKTGDWRTIHEPNQALFGTSV